MLIYFFGLANCNPLKVGGLDAIGNKFTFQSLEGKMLNIDNEGSNSYLSPRV
jgi:putative component of membrane protein insertase Oxa1/YidC/SpoIIIJ protein YidD